MAEQSTVTIIGCGYVGLTTAVILANCGLKIYAVEILPERLKSIKRGRSFFYEPGVDPLLKRALKDGHLVTTDSLKKALPKSDVIFSCVGTPDNPDGSSNLSYVFDAAAESAKLLKKNAVYVQKSTVPVGTGDRVLELFNGAGRDDIRYVSSPEFLREGTAISDTLWFDRIVAGSADATAVETVLDLYRAMEATRDNVAAAAGITPPADVPATRYISTSLHSAELIKVTANAFLALKISFANSIAKLSDAARADVVGVMDGVGADRRIGRTFLNAGRGYGGGCFPKDVSGLIRSAEEYGVAMPIMTAAVTVNDSMPHYIIGKLKTALGGSLKGRKVAVLGLAFKAGTSDTRRSPAIALANTLASSEAKVQAYDPEAMAEAKHDLHKAIALKNNVQDTLQNAECALVATDWPQFKTIDFGQFAGLKVVADAMNCLDAAAVEAAGLAYIGVGRS